MEDTCVGEKCWFYMLIKELIGDSKVSPDVHFCPFYVEMVWTPQAIGEKTQEAKIVKDCANKRSLLTLLNDIHPRLTGVQKSNEEMRNQTSITAGIFNRLFEDAAKVSLEKRRIKTIEQN